MMLRNITKRVNFKKFEKENRVYKILSNNTLLKKKERTIHARFRHRLGKRSAISIVRNTCLETYRNRGLVSKYKVSRFKFKDYMDAGYLTGIRKY